MGEIEWEDPPSIKHVTRTNKRHLIEAMKANPGRWLVWSRNSTRANASNIRARYPELEVEWAWNSTYDEDGEPTFGDRHGGVTIFTRWSPHGIHH